MRLARSTFYYRRHAQSDDSAAVVKRIEQICLDFPGYGYRRVTEQLKQDHHFVNHKRVFAPDAGTRSALPSTEKENQDHQQQTPLPQVSQSHQGSGSEPDESSVAG